MNTTHKSAANRLRSAFTLIELLVVIAIIAILAAILFPVFAQAREKARQAACISNEKQISLAVLQYVQDYDETFPMSEDGNTTGPGSRPWADAVQPYIKNGDQYSGVSYGKGGVWSCPSWPETGDPSIDGQGQRYGTNDMFISNYGRNTPDSIRATVPVSLIDAPADKVLFVEKGRKGTPWNWPDFSTLQSKWVAGSILTSGQVDPSKDGSGESAQPYNDRDGVASDNPGAWEGGRMIRYRHAGTSNVAFVDGHVKSYPKGTLKWYKNIYLPKIYERRSEDVGGWWPNGPQ